MSEQDVAYAVDSGWLVEVVNEHTCGAGPGSYAGMHEPGCGMVPVARISEILDLLDPAHDAALVAQARRDAEDARGGYRVAAEAADRFRDVLSECLGHADENPGDDVLVAELREHFGKTGPEPTRWRDFCAGAKATLDQINAARADAIARAGETPT